MMVHTYAIVKLPATPELVVIIEAISTKRTAESRRRHHFGSELSTI